MDWKTFYDFLRDDIPFKWTREHEKLFQNNKDRISEETILAVPNPYYPFHSHVDSSSIGTKSILVQKFPRIKRIVLFNYRVFTKNYQNVSFLHRELWENKTAVQTYEHFIRGSQHPIKTFCDHEPLLYLWTQKGRLCQQVFRYHVIITQFTNLQIKWTPRKNLNVTDLLSRKVSLKDLNGHQLAHNESPGDIRFFSQCRHQVQKLIDYNSSVDDRNYFYPIVCTHLGATRVHHVKNDGTDMIWTNVDSKFAEAFWMFFILSNEATTLTVDANGKLHQSLWRQKFIEVINLNLKPIVTKVTMRYPMRTIF